MKKKPLFPGVTEPDMPAVVAAMNVGIKAINDLPMHLRRPAYRAFVRVVAEHLCANGNAVDAIEFLQAGIHAIQQGRRQAAEHLQAEAQQAVKH